MIRKILVAFDDSEAARRAFDLAGELAEKFKARLILMAVVRLPEPTTSLEMGAILDDAKEHYEKAFQELRDRTDPRGIDFVTLVEVGHPAEHIVAMAEREHVDLIVMGRRGRTQVARWMLGSVSQKVLAYAHCPVTVVK